MLLVDKVYFYIKRKIDNNEFPSGFPIIEQNIQKELNISRTPIREAIRRLEKEDLIIKYPGKGAIVNAISLKEIIEIYQFRELVEPNIIPLVIGKIPRNLIDEIEKELQSIKNKKPLNIEKAEKVGRKVHDLITKNYANKTLEKIMEKLRSKKDRGCNLVHNSEEISLKLLNQHIKILNKLKENNAKEAKNIMLEHLRNAKRNIIY